MPSLPQPQPSDHFRRTVADVFGDRAATPAPPTPPAWPQAVAQVSAQLCEKLRIEVPTARLHKALELVLAHAVTLHADGSASVQSGKQTYTLAPHCPCPDAKNRSEMCKHALAVELHRRALALLDGTAHAPTSAAAAPSVAPAPMAPTSAAWQVHEAPTSACFRFRLGQGELTYTFRGVNDLEVLDRIHEHLPFLQAIVDGWEQRVAERAAARDAAVAQAQQVPAPADMQALLQQMLQQALAAQSNGAGAANGHAAANGYAHSQPTASDQERGWCSLHNVAMERRQNERGTWWSHELDNGRYCKGAK